MPTRMAPSLAITGIGAISAAGGSLAELNASFLAGLSHLACQDDAAMPLAARLPIARIATPVVAGPRVVALAEIAAREAVACSGIAPAALGLSLGSCTGGMHGSEASYLNQGPGPVDEAYREQPVGRTAASLHQRLGLGGPLTAHAEACASTAGAVAEAVTWIRAGLVPAVLVVGADALTRLTMAGFHSLQIVDARGCQPFSAERAGMSLGEGAVALVIEDEAHARQRGATVLARLLGWGLTADAHHATAPDPRGTWLSSAIAAALADGGADAAAVSFVAAHGTGTRDNDACEVQVLAQCFGHVPVSSSKRGIGHTMGAAAGFGLAAAMLALREQVLVPTAAWAGTPLTDVDVVTTTRAAVVDTALVTCLAFGGVNAAMLLGRA